MKHCLTHFTYRTEVSNRLRIYFHLSRLIYYDTSTLFDGRGDSSPVLSDGTHQNPESKSHNPENIEKDF